MSATRITSQIPPLSQNYQLHLKQPQYLSQHEINSMIDRSNAFSAKKQSKIESLKAQLQSEEDSQIYSTPHISEKTNQIAQKYIANFGSILDRFTTLEKQRKWNIMIKSNESFSKNNSPLKSAQITKRCAESQMKRKESNGALVINEKMFKDKDVSSPPKKECQLMTELYKQLKDPDTIAKASHRNSDKKKTYSVINSPFTTVKDYKPLIKSQDKYTKNLTKSFEMANSILNCKPQSAMKLSKSKMSNAHGNSFNNKATIQNSNCKSTSSQAECERSKQKSRFSINYEPQNKKVSCMSPSINCQVENEVGMRHSISSIGKICSNRQFAISPGQGNANA